MNNFDELRKAEEKAVAGLINFAQSDRDALTPDEVETIEKAMEIAGCNVPAGRTDRRKIEATKLLRDCITATDHAQLRKIEAVVMEIATR